MAIKGAENLTLLDVAKRTEKNNAAATVIELLSQSNPFMQDMTVIECNDGTSHKTTVRTGIPQGVWRRAYQGVPSVKTQVAQITEVTALLENRSHVDKTVADMYSNAAAYRLQEAQGIMEGMNQQMATSVLYENGDINTDRPMGLAPRYSTLNEATALSARNVIDGGGSGSDNTSIWLIVWGPNTVHGIYPNNAEATGGLIHRDLGEDDVNDENGNPFRAYKDMFQWHLGLCVRDWRYAVRIANIDTSALVSEVGAPDLVKMMIKAMHRVPMLGMGRAVFYCNRTVAQMLDIQSLDKGQNTLVSGNDVFGNPVTMCRNIPIRSVDALLSTEEAVTA